MLTTVASSLVVQLTDIKLTLNKGLAWGPLQARDRFVGQLSTKIGLIDFKALLLAFMVAYTYLLRDPNLPSSPCFCFEARAYLCDMGLNR